MFTSKRKLFSSERGAATSWLAGITLRCTFARLRRDPRGGKPFLTVSFLHVERRGRHRLGERFRFRGLCSGRRRSAHCRSHWLGRFGAGTCGWRHSLALLQKP